MIQKATEQNLSTLELWLYEEFVQNGSQAGFWDNIDIVRDACCYGMLYCLCDDQDVIAFCSMERDGYTPCLIGVRETQQRRGYGTELMQFVMRRAQDAGAVGLDILALDDSRGFWEALGFASYEHQTGGLRMRLLFAPRRGIGRADGRSVVLAARLFRKSCTLQAGETVATVTSTAKWLPTARRIYLDDEWVAAFPVTIGEWHFDRDIWLEVRVDKHRQLQGVWYCGRAKYLCNADSAEAGCDVPIRGVFRMRSFAIELAARCPEVENRVQRRLVTYDDI